MDTIIDRRLAREPEREPQSPPGTTDPDGTPVENPSGRVSLLDEMPDPDNLRIDPNAHRRAEYSRSA